MQRNRSRVDGDKCTEGAENPARPITGHAQFRKNLGGGDHCGRRPGTAAVHPRRVSSPGAARRLTIQGSLHRKTAEKPHSPAFTTFHTLQELRRTSKVLRAPAAKVLQGSGRSRSSAPAGTVALPAGARACAPARNKPDVRKSQKSAVPHKDRSVSPGGQIGFLRVV